MEDARFDRIARGLAGVITRRGTVAGLLGGLALPLMGASLTDARNRRGQGVHAEKKRKKCKSGLLTCTIKKGKKKKRFCVDAQNDPANCGACGNLCATGQTCQGGVCTCNGTLCSGCCDGKTCQAGASHQQCGTAGAVCQDCTGGRSCQNGVCTCPAGRTFCSGVCVDTTTDPANCGSCGTTCTLPRTCGGGGTPGVCGCTKTTCEAQGANCGAIDDGCGGDLDCGLCESNHQTCGGGGIPNVCGCRANGFVFPFDEGNFNCDPCCSGDCCFDSPGFAVCAGGCG